MADVLLLPRADLRVARKNAVQPVVQRQVRKGCRGGGRRRCVTMDNIGYGRYSGEIQLVRADLPADEKVNVIGEVPAAYDLLLDCIKRGKTFRMVKVL